MRKSIADGHDVQLHIHPQWLDAEYFNGKWLINDNMHRLPDLEKFETEKETLLKEAQEKEETKHLNDWWRELRNNAKIEDNRKNYYSL